MKRIELYSDAKLAFQDWRDFCDENKCEGCEYKDCGDPSECFAFWLNKETSAIDIEEDDLK